MFRNFGSEKGGAKVLKYIREFHVWKKLTENIFFNFLGRRMHRFTGGSRLQEARTYAGGEARA